MFSFSLNNIQALFARYIQQIVRDHWRLVSVFYWPLLELAVFGFLGTFRGQGTTESSLLIAGAILWVLVAHTYYFIVFNMLEELWSHNIVSLFATSVTLAEWAISGILMAAAMMGMLCFYMACMAYCMYGFSLLMLGWYLVPIIMSLFLFSVGLGSCLNALLLYAGVRGQSLVFMIGWLFAPFVGVYYPVTVLPYWMQMVAEFVPPKHIFVFVRALIQDNQVLYAVLAKAFILNGVWLIVGMLLLRSMYHTSMRNGLARLIT